MYTRNFYQDEEHMRIPENYDGTAMLERKVGGDDMINKDDSFSQVKISPGYKEQVEGKSNNYEQSNAKEEIPVFKNLFSKDLNLGSLIPTLGTEELLILALAAFLFFSKSGDKECALILLFLVFVK